MIISQCWRQALWVGVTLSCAAGCQSSRTQTGVADNSFRALFRPKAGSVSAHRFTDEKSVREPNASDAADLSLAYARWMEDVGNLIEARKHYSEVAEEKPKNMDAVLGLARIDQISGRTHEAEQGFQKALKLSPNSPEALNALGQFYASQSRWPEAIEHLNRAMLAAPAEPTYRYNLAVALVHTGDVNAAMPHFVRTVGDAESHYNAGLILREENRLQQAEEQMLLAVTKKPDLHQAQYWLDELRREQEMAVAAGPAQVRTAPQGVIQTAARQPLPSTTNAGFAPPSHSVPPAATVSPQTEQQRNQRPPAW